jgi:hypothetical protein
MAPLRILWIHYLLLLAALLCVAAYSVCGLAPETMLYPASVALCALSAWCLLSWRMCRGSLFSPYALFLSAAILFNAGQFLLYAAGIETQNSILQQFPPEILLECAVLVGFGLGGLHAGGLMALRCRRDTRVPAPQACMESRLRPVRAVGWVMLAVSIVPWVLTVRERLSRVLNYGYFVGVFGFETATGVDHVPEILAQAFVPAAIFLLAGSRRRGGLLVSGSLLAAFTGASLFAGSKGPALMAVFAWGWVWHRMIRPIPKSMMLAAALAIVLIVIPVVTATRDIEGRYRTSLDGLLNAYSGIETPLVSALSEMGWTGLTICHTLVLVPSVRPYDLGASYGHSVLSAVPNVFGGLHPAKARGFLSDWLAGTIAPQYAARGGGFGYSFIAEAYANFGWFGAPLALALIGFLMGRLFGWGETGRDPARAALVGCWLSSVLLFARGESALMLRSLVWYAAIPYFAVELSHRKSLRRAWRAPAWNPDCAALLWRGKRWNWS